MSEHYQCPSCQHDGMIPFFALRDIPTNSCILMESVEEAVNFPRGDIDLCFCPECEFISNMAFEQKLTEYSGRYEETQGFSETFNKFHRHLAHRLIEKYNLHGKDVIEIGCGKGEFITMLSEYGDNRGVGFDPGYLADRNTSKAAGNIRFITDFYSEKYTDYRADFICCKMTLEHIHPTRKFIKTVRRSIGDRKETIVFFQVPEATRILKDIAFEDIYYEHCSYFTPYSFSELFRGSGFKVINVETEYDHQYLTIEAVPDNNEEFESVDGQLESVKSLVKEFEPRFTQKKQDWCKKLKQLQKERQTVVLWGSGSKAVSFLNIFDQENSVEYVVDINPHRHGYFMPGTGQKIVSPEFLKSYKPDLVIIMNRIYQEEIKVTLRDSGLLSEVLCL